MVKKNFAPTTKSEEMLELLEEYAGNDRLRMVAEFEADFERQLLERKLADKEKELEAINSQYEAVISQSKVIISQNEVILSQNEEIKALKAKLEANGISY